MLALIVAVGLLLVLLNRDARHGRVVTCRVLEQEGGARRCDRWAATAVGRGLVLQKRERALDERVELDDHAAHFIR